MARANVEQSRTRLWSRSSGTSNGRNRWMIHDVGCHRRWWRRWPTPHHRRLIDSQQPLNGSTVAAAAFSSLLAWRVTYRGPANGYRLVVGDWRNGATVHLMESSGFCSTCSRSLSVPVIVVRVGACQPDHGQMLDDADDTLRGKRTADELINRFVTAVSLLRSLLSGESAESSAGRRHRRL